MSAELHVLPAFKIVLAATALVACPGTAPAQLRDHDTPRAATSAEVLGGNILLGGLTAATRALLSGKDPLKAFSIGAVGGAVYLAGKNLAVEPGVANGWFGLALASTGSSMISNAGRGVSLFEELSIPIASARVRLTPRDARKVQVVLNGFETAVLISAAFTKGLELDWTRTAASGTAVFVTRDLRIVSEDGEESGGLAYTSVVVISGFSRDAARTMRHEVVHVQQHWFMQDAWGRPIEDVLRPKVPGARFIPRWLELGVALPALLEMEAWLPGRSGLKALREAEAGRLERR